MREVNGDSLAAGNPKVAADLTTRVVAFIHAVLACTLAFRALLEPNSAILDDHIWGVSERATLCFIVSSGFDTCI